MVIILSIVAALAIGFSYIVYKKYTAALEENASCEERIEDLNMVVSALQNQLHNSAATKSTKRDMSIRVKSTAKKTQGKKTITKTVVAPEPPKRGRKKANQ